MSAETLSTLASAALSQTFNSKLNRQFNRRAVLAKNLPVVQDLVSGVGKNVAWDVLFSGASAASFAEGSDVTVFDTDPAQPAILSWGMYRSAFQLSNLEINAANASMANAVALGQLVSERMDNSITKMISVINQDLFTGTGTDGSGNPNIIGLNAAIAATGSYAGIAQGSYSEWAGNVSANGGVGRPLTFDLLAGLESQIFNAYGEPPKVIVTSPGVVQKYEGLFTSVLRTAGDRSAMSYGAGMSELFWRGIPVIRDRNCPTGTLYMLNTDHIDVRVLPWASVPDGVDVKGMNLPSSNGEEEEGTGLSALVYPLARTGSAVKFVAEMYLQMRLTRRNAFGKMLDVSE